MFCLPDTLDQGQVTNYFCRISLVMYLVYYNYSNAGPECQAKENLYMVQMMRFLFLKGKTKFWEEEKILYFRRFLDSRPRCM